MNTNLKIISAYQGLKAYIQAASDQENPDFQKLWLDYVIAPYWNDWAAGQFNETRIREEIQHPMTDLSKLEQALEILSDTNVEEMIAAVHEKILKILPYPEPLQAVCIYINQNLGASVHGVMGSGVGDNILIQINPLFPGWESYLPWVLAHEYHHSIWGYHYYFLNGNSSQNLLTTLLCEGEADSFAKSFCPELLPVWVDALTPQQEHEYWSILQSYLYEEASMELHIRFFFGNDKTGTPPFVGYTIGFHIVQAYLASHPETSFAELTDMDTKDILLESGY